MGVITPEDLPDTEVEDSDIEGPDLGLAWLLCVLDLRFVFL